MIAKWVNSARFINSVKVEIQGMDRMGIINDISTIISNHLHIDMKGISINSIDGIFIGTISLEIRDKEQLEKLLKELTKIEGIKKVKRL